MNREQKSAAIAEIAAHIDQSDAVFAVDYKGLSVPQAAELRARLRDADATFKVVKNSLTERAAEQAGADALVALLEGPTALTFVRGDVATAAKAIADYGRATQLLPFKGGLMDGAPLDPDQLRALSRLPSREVLYGQLVGVVAAPVSGLVRTLNALLGGLAVALGQVREKKESGAIPAGEPPAAPAQTAAEAEPAAEVDGEAPAGDAKPTAEAQPAAEARPAAEPEPAVEAGGESTAAEAEPAVEADGESTAAEPEPAAEAEGQSTAAEAEPAAEAAQAEPVQGEPAQIDDHNKADASAPEPEAAEANPTKED
jgi:large subunit ribosomal protein L10